MIRSCRRRRTVTCVDRNSAGRLRWWAKLRALPRCYSEIIAVQRLAGRTGVIRHGWNAALVRPRGWRASHRRRREHRQRQIRMMGLDRLIQPFRQFALRATARNAIRLRHRRCGEPAIAAVRARSARAPRRSRHPDAIRRSIRAVFSGLSQRLESAGTPSPITPENNSAVTALAVAKPGQEAPWRHYVLPAGGRTSNYSLLGMAAFREPRLARLIKAPFESEMRKNRPRYRNFISRFV